MSLRRRSGMYGVHAVVGRGHVVCLLVGGFPLVGVSIIGGSTVADYPIKSFRFPILIVYQTI